VVATLDCDNWLSGKVAEATRAAARRHGLRKPRFSAADYNDTPHDQRAIDRDIATPQFRPHQQVGTVAVSLSRMSASNCSSPISGRPGV
jgi:hypothetical protein